MEIEMLASPALKTTLNRKLRRVRLAQIQAWPAYGRTLSHRQATIEKMSQYVGTYGGGRAKREIPLTTSAMPIAL